MPAEQSSFRLPPDLIDLAQAARSLHRSPRTLRRDAAAGRIPAVRIGGVWRFHPEVIANVMATGLSVGRK